MDTYITYFDETGDDGNTTASSDIFVLTSLYMNTSEWQPNYDRFKAFRKSLYEHYGFHASQEMHTRHFLRDKGLYRPYGWTLLQRKEILIAFTKAISSLNIRAVNVIIDKNNINVDDYDILENALKYNIQRIENDSSGQWKYLIITDQGRIIPMRKTARKIRVYNPVQSHFGGTFNQPIRGLIEDILEKDSKESYFIQACDFISSIVQLYYKYVMKNEDLPKRIGQVIDKEFIARAMATFEAGGILNTQASSYKYGLVIYPR